MTVTIVRSPARRIAALAALATLAVLPVASPATAAIPPVLRTEGTLAVCSYRHFAPVSFGEGEGYEADLVRAIAAVWGVAVSFTPIETFDGIWLTPSDPALGCDLAIGGITPTEARIEQGATFSPLTARYAQTLLVRRADVDSGRIAGYPSFAGTDMVIGVVPGTTGEEYGRIRAAEAGLAETAIRTYPSEDELLVALAAGEIDAIARGEIGNRYQESIDPSVVTVDPRDFGDGFGFALDPANPDLIAAIAATLGLVTADGTIGFADWLADPGIFLATAGIPEQPEREAAWMTKGTFLRLQNETGGALFFRVHHPFHGWSGIQTLPPNEWRDQRADWPAYDDVEIRLFKERSAADANDADRSIDIQAENPAWNAPWVSWNFWEEFFQSEGESHDIRERCTLRDSNSFRVTRENDSSDDKRFLMVIRKVAIPSVTDCHLRPY
ncbi:MAG: substrate-binding periplasmic protein [Chloroflexota bacterium]